MDAITQGLLNFGIGGAMAAAVLWWAWYRETKTLPALMDLFRDEMGKERAQCERYHQDGIQQHRETRHAVNNLRQELLLARAMRPKEEKKEP